jgi:hypothetical protein
VVAACAVAGLVLLILAVDRLPFVAFGMALAVLVFVAALPPALLPISMAGRYRKRAHNAVLGDPEQAFRDLSRALELEPQSRALLIDRARVLRLLGQHARAAQDLRAYLERPGGEPHARVLRARLLLQHIEASRSAASSPARPRVGVET